MGLAADQGGSIRIPSCWCGIVGMKPTWGLVPYTGGICIDPCLDHAGTMARTVADCALLLEVFDPFTFYNERTYERTWDSFLFNLPKNMTAYGKDNA